jgi:hypothetical protein
MTETRRVRFGSAMRLRPTLRHALRGKEGRTLASAVLLLTALVACKNDPFRQALSSQRAQPTAEALTQAYASKNGLITVRYPGSFAAKTVGKSSIVLARNLSDGTDEALVFVSVEKPISDELAEFARVVNGATVKELDHYSETSSRAATCNGQPGIEAVGTWGQRTDGGAYRRRACFFLRQGHGYAFTYSMPETHVATDDALLLRIREATEFNR